jgi:AGCS family alanine or glycine:cation symporter
VSSAFPRRAPNDPACRDPIVGAVFSIATALLFFPDSAKNEPIMEAAYEKIRSVLESVDSFVWHPLFMVTILLGTGLYLTVRFMLPQIRFFRHAWGLVLGRYDKPEHKGEVSHFQALSAALSATVGIGNIAGVATAIHLGGPGATFWLWVSGFFGMATKMTECSLAVRFRKIGADGIVSGGPMHTIRNGLKKRWRFLAYLFAVFCAFSAAFGAGNTVQANTIAVQINDALAIPRWVIGLVISSLVALVILGGIRRIAWVASIIVPFMAFFYCTGALLVLLFNLDGIPEAFKLIFSSAFSGTAVFGGFVGVGVKEAIRFGIARGTFSNEAGQGSAPIAHSAARSDPPVREGFVALLEPFIDTIVICTLTSFVIIATGAWKEKVAGELDLAAARVFGEKVANRQDAADETKFLDGLVDVRQGIPQGSATFFNERSTVDSPKLLLDGKPFSGSLEIRKGKTVGGSILVPGKDEGTSVTERIKKIKLRGSFCQTGAVLSAHAFETHLGILGLIIVTVGVLLFGYSTSISWSYYGDRAIEFLLGRKAVLPYRILFVILNFTGAVVTLNIVWTLADICNAMMIFPNLISLWLLSGVVSDMVKKYRIKDQVPVRGIFRRK